jgi:hypothetical protein
MTQEKKSNLTIDDIDHSFEKATLNNICEVPISDNKSICYEIKADKLNLSSEGLVGRVKLTRYSKEIIVETTLVKKTQKPKIQTKEDWTIYSGWSSLLTNGPEKITLNNGTNRNYKIGLKNAGIDYVRPTAINPKRKYEPQFISAKLLNEVCVPLDEQLVEMYKLLMK